jgi:hypothetical protein
MPPKEAPGLSPGGLIDTPTVKTNINLTAVLVLGRRRVFVCERRHVTEEYLHEPAR